ncbi:hypothetical protein DFJ67_0689 [Asanoa ferruginea]|uniref:Uncharacterized protein n=1 Tax=Asanoa ferruginea TaxID=53367 RepID=A0A3D9ZBG6_9ACTN|nr:hypothetical protein [Asanoa ferruginea]REF94748.1 hypothetical protein DFJ67_0689 [Asanoa ferruginea]GIF45676.1 hypothetical protein Afe04nite_02150 [Asanoa ferruginea]
MTGLREHFAETAAGAKHYDVTEVVLRRTRRRRRLTQAVAAAAVVAIAASAGVLLSGDRPRPGPSITEIDATGPVGAGRIPWLPATFKAADAVALPAGRAVGAGALVYQRGAVYVLLTSKGESYAIPGEARGLSPDGRWLAYGANGKLVFRDLTGIRAFTTAESSVTGWSVEGAVAVLAPPWPGVGPVVATILDLDTGASRAVPIPDPEWWQPRGLTADGELLLTARQEFPATKEPPATGEPLPTVAPAQTLTGPPRDLGAAVGIINPVDQQAHTVELLASRLGLDDRDKPGAGLQWGITARPDTGGLVFQTLRTITIDGSDAYMLSDVFEVDPNTGWPLRRYRLPAMPTLDSPAAWLIGTLPEGILLGTNDGGFDARDFERLELLDPTTGARQTVLSLPDAANFLLTRGGRLR